jgi:hypothetical protein
MKRNLRIPFSNLKFENWQNLFLIFALLFYLILFGAMVGKKSFLVGYGTDYLAFWSAGKIADEKGYSEIYDLNNLRSVQIQELNDLGFQVKTDDPSFSPIPAPYFSFFLLLFQLLSRVDLVYSCWLWTVFNMVLLIGYLVFSLRKTLPAESTLSSNKKILFLMILSFPVFKNLIEGQLNIFLLVCTGEFLRYALIKKPVLSGLWLGGLLLKPQLLILIIPIILIMRNWRVMMGFIVSSGVILMTSFFLSGFAGMNALFNLWTKWGEGNYPINIINMEVMINWRMVAVNLNALLNTSFGWVIAGLGMALTLFACLFLAKRRPAYGTSQWVMTMLVIFSATLAISWHTHHYMAVVLIPFLLYAYVFHRLPVKVVSAWVIVLPVTQFVIIILAFFLPLFLPKTDLFTPMQMIIAFCGFFINLFILIHALRSLHPIHILPEIPSPENTSG